MVQQVSWNDGSSDKLYFSYSASEGNQTVTVTSDANTGINERSKNVTFTVVAGGVTIERTLTITQPAKSNKLFIITRNNEFATYNYVGIGYK